MSFAEYSIKRPVTVLMVVISIVVLGFISLRRLPLELLPNFSSDSLSVSVSYPSSSPTETERDITRPLEEALSTLNHLDTIESTSSGSSSEVRLEFKEGTDMDMASLEIRDRIDQVRGLLPEGVERIRIRRWHTGNWPVFRFAVGWNGDRKGLYNFLEEVLRPRLERIQGVANVDTRGIQDKQVLVEVDPSRLESHGIDIWALSQALRSNNVNLSGGYVFDGDKKYALRTMGEFQEASEIEALPLAGGRFTLGDIADVRYDFPEKTSFSRLDRNESINVYVYKASTANIVEVCQAARAELDRLTSLPRYADLLSFQVTSDQSGEILNSIHDLGRAGLIGGLLACLVLFAFLRTLRSTLIIAAAIPVSVLCTFGFMYLLRVGAGSEININLVTLMGLMVAIGMLVDASVVVMENIFRHKQDLGLGALDAAIQGTKEVGIAVVASVATTISVFASFFFLEGSMSRYMSGFGTVVSIALLSSLVVGLTLIPLASSRMFTGREKKKQKSLLLLTDGYAAAMGFLLKWRFTALIVMALIGWASYSVLMRIDREQMPRVAEREVNIDILFENSYTMDEIESIFAELEQLLLDRQAEFEITSVASEFGRRGGRSGRLRGELEIYLKDEGNITPTQVLQEKMLAAFPVIPGVEFKRGRLRHYGGGGEMGIDVKLKGEDPTLLEMYGEIVKSRILEVPGIRDAQTTLETGDDEIHVQVDRRRSEQFGVSPQMVARTLSSALSTRATTRIKGDQGEIDVIVQMRGGNNISLQEIENIHFENRHGEMIPLYSVVDYQYRKGPLAIRREDRKATLNVYASLQQGAASFLANMGVREALSDLRLPPGYSWSFGRSWRSFRESEDSNFFAVGLAMILMYIIMASLFESFIHPLTILFTVPFSMIGVAGLFYLTGTTLNSMAYLGILVLFGLVVNNGIILIDHINRLRKSGLEKNAAIIQGGRDRLRPILMTALTSLFGLLPLTVPFFLPDLFPQSEGRGRMWAPVSLAVFGGLTTSTFLTLLILPTVYSYMDDVSVYSLRAARFLLSLPERSRRGRAVTS